MLQTPWQLPSPTPFLKNSLLDIHYVVCIISVYMPTQRINITLQNDLIRDLRMSIPPRGRSRFIAEALEERLSKKRNMKKECVKALKANREFNRKIAKKIEEDFKYADAEVLSKIP